MRGKQIGARCAGAILAALLFLGNAPAPQVAAQENIYTVTFRPGDVGVFTDPEGIGESYVNSGAAVDYEITQHKAVKLRVKAGTTLPALLQAEDVKADPGYFAKSAAQWGPAAGLAVDRNLDYVVDYGRLVDGVEYTVTFTDSQSGVQIAPSATAYANVGDIVTYTAPSSIISHQQGIYSLQGEAGKQMTLSADSGKNILTYTYTNLYDPGTNIVENVVTVEGPVEEETVTNVVFVNGAAISAARAPAAGGEADARAGENEPEDNPGGAAVIEDEETPLAGDAAESDVGDNPGGADTVTIEDQEVPGAGAPEGEAPNSAALAIAAVGAAALAALIIWFKVRRKKKEQQ